MTAKKRNQSKRDEVREEIGGGGVVGYDMKTNKKKSTKSMAD